MNISAIGEHSKTTDSPLNRVAVDLQFFRHIFLSSIGALLALGLVMVYSASITARPTEFEQVYFVRHLTYLTVAVITGSLTAWIPRHWWRRSAPTLFAGTVALLMLMLVPGVGSRVKGATRWFRFGSVSVQPSEFAKIAVPLFVCWVIGRRWRGPSDRANPTIRDPSVPGLNDRLRMLGVQFAAWGRKHGARTRKAPPLEPEISSGDVSQSAFEPASQAAKVLRLGKRLTHRLCQLGWFSLCASCWTLMVLCATLALLGRVTSRIVRSLLWANHNLCHKWSEHAAGATLATAIAIPVVLIAVEPDLGTAMFVAAVGALALWASGWPLRYFVGGGCVALFAIGALVAVKPYQQQRLRDFVAVWSDFQRAHYQVRQSLTTLGAGGWNGTGLGSGVQKLSFLPEANTDFVFAVVGEELGLVGTLGLSALWLTVYTTGLRMISLRIEAGRNLPSDRFETAAAFSLLTSVVIQAAINVAVVTAMAPAKGISHPLISYGGSNLLASVIALGMVVSLTRSEVQS